MHYKTLFGTSASTLARIQYTTGLIDVVPKTEGFIYVIRYKEDGKWKLQYDTTHLYLTHVSHAFYRHEVFGSICTCT